MRAWREEKSADVIYSFHNKLVFVPGKSFQPNLVFKDKHSSLFRNHNLQL
jgi:hypothetical protein